MQIVWRLGLPSSNQLSGCTTRPGTASKGHHRADRRDRVDVWPGRRRARSRASATPEAHAEADNRAALPSRRIDRGSAPGRHECPLPGNPCSSALCSGTKRSSMPPHAIQQLTRSSSEPAIIRKSLHAGVAMRSNVSTRPKRATALASSTRTRTTSPTSRSGPSNTTIRSLVVRPVNWLATLPTVPAGRLLARPFH